MLNILVLSERRSESSWKGSWQGYNARIATNIFRKIFRNIFVVVLTRSEPVATIFSREIDRNRNKNILKYNLTGFRVYVAFVCFLGVVRVQIGFTGRRMLSGNEFRKDSGWIGWRGRLPSAKSPTAPRGINVSSLWSWNILFAVFSMYPVLVSPLLLGLEAKTWLCEVSRFFISQIL